MRCEFNSLFKKAGMPSRQPKRTVETRRSKLRCYQKPALGRFFHVPQKLLSILEFQRGDKFEVMEKDGGIFLCPVVVYPKEKLILMRQLTVKRQIL